MKKIKIKQSDVGRWVTVKWDDVGRIDSLLVDYDKDGKYGYARVFEPYNNRLTTITMDQIVEKRKFLNAQ